MQKINVSSVETKPTKNGGNFTVITDAKGARFSGFEAALMELKEGDIIEADIQVDGKYTNILSHKVIGKTGPQPGAAPSPCRQQDDRSASTEAQKAAELVMTDYRAAINAGKPVTGMLENLYIKALAWCDLKIIVPVSTTASAQPYTTCGVVAPKAAAPAVSSAANPPLSSPAIDAFDRTYGKPEPELERERAFASRGDFLTAAWKEKHLGRVQVCERLKVVDITEVDDLGAAWKQLGAVPK